jgi:hypothetical protein
MGIPFKWLIGNLLLASQLPASQFLFSTPAGAVNPDGGSPVAATALFTVSGGKLQITVENTEANPNSESEALAQMTFQVSESLTKPSMTSSADLVTVDSNGTFTTTNPTSTGWTLTANGSTLTLCGSCSSAWPAHTLIGPPSASTGKYTDANSSIAGSKSHNPFLWESADFTIASGALEADAQIANVVFNFGTNVGEGAVDGIGGLQAPEPTTIPLFAGGALMLAFAARRRKSCR